VTPKHSADAHRADGGNARRRNSYSWRRRFQRQHLCPVGNTVLGLSGASYNARLSGNNGHCSATILPGTAPALALMGPIPPFAYMSQYPLRNHAIGRYLNTAGYGFHAPTDTSRTGTLRNGLPNITADASIASRSRAPWPTEDSAGAPFSPVPSGTTSSTSTRG